MSEERSENPIHAPVRHPNQKGDEPRIRLGGGPFVDTATLAQLTEWQRRGSSYGELIDRLTSYALAAGYDPVTQQHHKKTKTGAPGKTHERRLHD